MAKTKVNVQSRVETTRYCVLFTGRNKTPITRGLSVGARPTEMRIIRAARLRGKNLFTEGYRKAEVLKLTGKITGDHDEPHTKRVTSFLLEDTQ